MLLFLSFPFVLEGFRFQYLLISSLILKWNFALFSKDFFGTFTFIDFDCLNIIKPQNRLLGTYHALMLLPRLIYLAVVVVLSL